jgi:hypothetical protein
MNAKNWGDPQVKAYLDASTAYNNAQREKLGLSPIASFAGRGKRFRNPFGNPRAFARTSSTSKGYKSIAKSSKSVQVKLPKLSVKLPKSKTLTKAGKAFKLKA